MSGLAREEPIREESELEEGPLTSGSRFPRSRGSGGSGCPRAAMAASGELVPCSVYFCGSIRGGREDQALYSRIVSRLRRYGKVLTEHVADAELEPRGEATRAGDSQAGDL
jgi:hypothetical protein